MVLTYGKGETILFGMDADDDAERMMSVDQRCCLSLCFVDEMSNVSGTLAIVANSNRIMQHSDVIYIASDIVVTEVQIPL